jgi:quercetin dioxygenase-like cupin family protein
MTTLGLHWRRNIFLAVLVATITISPVPSATSQPHDTEGRCVPVSQRAGYDFGCFIITSEKLGRLGSQPMFWHLDTYASRPEAEAAKGPRGTVVQSLGKIWLFTIAEADWRPPSGERVAKVGPLPIESDTAYTAMYMEAVFQPGMKSVVHRHSGPEAWYTLTGQTCLETPDGVMVDHAGDQNLVGPAGRPWS